MLLARAFVLGLSPRAILAVAALALSIAYALTSAGALSTLEGQAGTLDEAREHPGFILYDAIASDAQPTPFQASRAPAGALIVNWATDGPVRIATLKPPSDPAGFPEVPTIDRVIRTPYAGVEAEVRAEEIAQTYDLPGPEKGTPDYLPRDAILVPPEVFDALYPHRADEARLAYVPGNAPPDTTLQSVPWQGIGVFYEQGAAQLNSGLVGVIIATGVIASLLASGLIYLEVLARRLDLATIEALGGRRLVRRLVILRTLALVVAGILMGILVALVALRLAGVAMGTPLRVPPAAWLATILAVGTGAMLAGSIAGMRALARHGLRASGTTSMPVRRFPGPYRFLTLTPRVFPGVFAATLVTAMILLVIAGAGAVPETLFEAPEEAGMRYVGAGSGNILRGSVDRMLGTHGHYIPGIDTAIAETFAPTTAKGRPLMVRGVDHDTWRAHQDARLVQGDWPDDPAEATIGLRAHRTTGIGPGDTLLLPASYHRGAQAVVVTGIHRTGGLEDDELMPDLDTAGMLAGLAPDRVTGVRVVLDDPRAQTEIPSGEGVQATSIQITPRNPVPHTTARADITFLNFDKTATTHTFDLRVGGEIHETITTELPPRSETILQVPFVVPDVANVRVQVNPSQDVQTRPLTLTLRAPEVARPGEAFELQVEDLRGEDVAQAAIHVDDEAVATTDAQGRAAITVATPRLADIVAIQGEDAGYTRLRVAPSDWDGVSMLRAERLHVDRPFNLSQEQGTIRASVTLVNLGGVDHDGILEWHADDRRHISFVDLASGARTTHSTQFDLPVGTYNLTVAGVGQSITISPPREGPGDSGGTGTDEPDETPEDTRPRTVQEAIAAKRPRSGAGSDRPGDALDTFLSTVIGNLESATFLVVLATVIHGGSLVWVSILRDVRERERVSGLLRSLGATQDQLRNQALKDVTLAALPPILLALATAPLLLWLVAQWGYPAAFGHTLPVQLDLVFLVRTGGAILLIAILAAVYGVLSSGRNRAGVAHRKPLDEWLASEREPAGGKA